MIKYLRITTVPMSLHLLVSDQHHFLRSKGWEVHLASGPGEPAFSDPNYLLLPLSRELSPLADLQALWHLYKWLRKLKPHIVHTHTPKAGLIGMLAARFAAVPIRLHTIAGLPEMEAKGSLRLILRITERITAWSAHAVYPNSKGIYNYIKSEKLVPPSKLRFIGYGSSNGIDTTLFSPSEELKARSRAKRAELGIPENHFCFVYAGRLDNDKGMRELSLAFQNILSDIPHWHLLLVGPLEKARRGLSDDTLAFFEQHERIYLVGFQTDMPLWLSCGDALVFPSYREGFPNVPLQAAALGLPVIATQIPGCSEIVEHNFNGFLIPTKDEKALERACRELGNMREEDRKAMGRRSILRVAERFERSQFWKYLWDEYQFWIREKKLHLLCTPLSSSP